MARLAGLFLAAPMISSAMIPLRQRALLVMMLAAATYPMLRGRLLLPRIETVADLLPIVGCELLLGLCMGLLAAMPILAMDAAGVISGQSMGFGLARVYNPEADIDTDILGQLLVYIATGIFAVAGGVERLGSVLLTSFERVPIGAPVMAARPLETLLGSLSSGFELALRVSLPVIGTAALMMIVLGVMTKTLPQLNIMTVGFTIKILAGLAVLVFAAEAIAEAVGVDISAALNTASAWVQSLAGGSHG